MDMDFSDDEELAAALGGDDSELSDLDEASFSSNDDIDVNSYRDDGLLDINSGDDDEVSGEDLQSLDLTDAKAMSKSAGPGKEHDRKSKKHKLKGLPTFASADDYAKMLADGSDENGGGSRGSKLSM